MHRHALAGALVFVACAAKPVQVVEEVAEAPEVISLGERQLGELKWMSANARFVALYLYPPRASDDHAMYPTPLDLVLFDTVLGSRESLQEIVATDPRGRHAVALAGPHLWLLDAETGAREDLAAGGADLTGDRMRCAGGRQAAFDPWGAELLYLRTDPDRAVVRRLRTGEEYEVRAPAWMVWRAEPTGAPGWVRFHVVPRDTDGDGALTYPRLEIECEAWIDWSRCNDCFMSPPRRLGDREGIVLAHVDGTRVVSGFGGEPEPIADRGAVWQAYGGDTFGVYGDSDRLVRADGTDIEPPPGCVWRTESDAALAMIKCEDDLRIYRRANATTIALPGVEELADGRALDREGSLWISAWLKTEGETRLGRVRLDDGRIEPGPPPLAFGRGRAFDGDRRGWSLVLASDWESNAEDEGFAYDVTTGRALRLPGYVRAYEYGVVQRDERLFAVDLAGGRVLPIPGRPVAVAKNGCALVGPGKRSMFDSWELLCPPRRSLRPGGVE